MRVSVDTAWHDTLREIMANGHIIAPRGAETREVIGHSIKVDMTMPVVANPQRAAIGGKFYQFMCGSAAWMLRGDNRVATLTPFAPSIGQFSDNGVIFYGAYGPRIRAQLPYLIETLRDHPTRQAVIGIWEPSPPKTKDLMCTVAYSFYVHDGQLDMVTFMRSNDAWIGMAHDVFDSIMLAAYVALESGLDVRLGELTHVAGSRHVYTRNETGIFRCLAHGGRTPYARFDFRDFKTGDGLIDHLAYIASYDHREPKVRTSNFLMEFM